MSFHIGTSGYTYSFWDSKKLTEEKDAILNVYKTSNVLQEYTTLLNSVEINCTRYQKLTPDMTRRWYSTTPSSFTFTIKMPLYITHQKKLCDFEEWWKEFYLAIKELKDKLASLLFQFDDKFKCTESNYEKLVEVKRVVPKEIFCAFEFRDRMWAVDGSDNQILNKKLQKLFVDKWTSVVSHHMATDPRVQFGNLDNGLTCPLFVSSNFLYLRLHGSKDYSCGTYGYNRLLEMISFIKKFEFSKVLIYFNNTDTWEFQNSRNPDYIAEVNLYYPNSNYCRHAPKNQELTPSAIFDAMCAQFILSCD